MIQLLIEDREVELKDDLSISFTYQDIDPNKLSTIKNSFSKTVDIPGTNNNNNIFGDLFRIDRYIPATQIEQDIDGDRNIGFQFDPHKKAEFTLLENGTLITNGYLTLNNIVISNEVDITYQVTLYGGIGNFFYNLANIEKIETNPITNERETIIKPKKLYDLYWSWNKKGADLAYYEPLFPDNSNVDSQYWESNGIIMDCSTRSIVDSYHKLKPVEEIYEEDDPDHRWENYWNSEYNRPYPITDVDKDVVFLPCYTGKYENFDSNKMLVNTAIGRYNIESYMSPENRDKYFYAFPDDLTVDEDGTEVTYSTLDKNLQTTDLNCYGLVTFPRDLDPWEAGDIRANEMPVAIRLSKLMRTISLPWNNGGYDVEWDEDILNSPYWNYSWVTLGKMDTEKNSITTPSYEFFTDYNNLISFSHNYDEEVNAFENGDPYYIYYTGDLGPQNRLINGVINSGQYDFRIYINPLANLSTAKKNKDKKSSIISGFKRSDGRIYNFVNLVIHDILYKDPDNPDPYSANLYRKILVDAFFYTENPNQYSFGLGEEEKFRTALINKVRDRYITLINPTDDIIVNIHNITPDVRLELEQEFDWQGNTIEGIIWESNAQYISTRLNLTQSYRVVIYQDVYGMFISYDPSVSDNAIAGFVGLDNTSTTPPYNNFGNFMFTPRPGSNNWEPLGTNNNQLIYENFSFDISDARSGLFLANSETGIGVLKLTKSKLFSESDTPFKYFSDFIKMMNYKIICDDKLKKIYVKTLKNYYKGNNISEINNLIDYSRDINIKNITTDVRRFDIGLETPDTYPIELFNRISKDKFNTLPYDTKIQWNQKTDTLLNNLCYKNTLEWQQSSIFYRIYPQFPRPYNTPTISWTLFNTEGDELKKNEFFTKGCYTDSTNLIDLTEENDFIPKVSFFDRDNKYFGCGGNLIFLNGFVKNYDYNYVKKDFNTLSPDSIVDNKYIAQSTGNVSGSTNYQIWQYDNIDTTATYRFSGQGPSNSAQAFINYFNSNGQFIGYEFHIADNPSLVNAEFHPIAGTKTIKINMRKQYQSSYKLEIERSKYVISPRVSFTEDTTVQYYLNNKRCYLNDFNYYDTFKNWGSYSLEQRGTATSWIIPFFTRDLYNNCVAYQREEYETRRLKYIRKYDNTRFNNDGTSTGDTDWCQIEYEFPTDGEVVSATFNARYPSTANGWALWSMTRQYGTIRYEGNFTSSGQHEFVDASINLSPGEYGGLVGRVRLNTYKDYGDYDTYYVDVVLKKIIQYYEWEPSYNILASWNLVYQDSLYNNDRLKMYSLDNTTFIRNPEYNYTKTIATNNYDWETNEYSFSNNPIINLNNLIFNDRWKDYMNDLYDRNTRDVTLYIDLTGLGMPNDILRNIYSWKGFLWIITKIENKQVKYLGKDKFTKCIIHKIKDLDTWTNNY